MQTQVHDLGFRPRKWQDEVFRQLARFTILVIHRRAGKTVLALMKLIDSALKCNRPMGRFGYIAPELKQAKLIAWDYLKSYAHKVPGTLVNESETWVQFAHNGARIRLFGADNPDSLRGQYLDGVVLDEVAQMQRSLWGEVIIPAISDRKGWVLFIGTPKGINLFSELYYAAASKPDWYARLITVNDTGIYTPEELLAMQGPGGMTPREYRQEMLCDFMASTDNTLISLDTANAAAQRRIELRHYEFAPMVLGVDVAWEGGDRCSIFPRKGLQAFAPEVYAGLPEKTFAGKVAQAIQRHKAEMTFVDCTGGYGGEVVSRLTELGFPVMAVNFASTPDSERFVNRRAEMWFKMADWLKEGAIPNDTALISEMCAPTYSNDNAAMRLKLESKKDVKDRIGCSPDIADSLALTFAYPVMTKMREEEAVSFGYSPMQPQQTYNPYAKDGGQNVYTPTDVSQWRVRR